MRWENGVDSSISNLFVVNNYTGQPHRFEYCHRDYAAALATAVKNWFWNLPSGEDIPKKFPFLWPNRLIEGKIAQVFLKLNPFCRFWRYHSLGSQILTGWRSKKLRPAPPGNGAPGEKQRLHWHSTNRRLLARIANYRLGGQNSRYVVGDCENRAAHSHNRHHELSLGFGGVGMVFSYGDSM